jgi:hypothetical protein
VFMRVLITLKSFEISSMISSTEFRHGRPALDSMVSQRKCRDGGLLKIHSDPFALIDLRLFC